MKNYDEIIKILKEANHEYELATKNFERAQTRLSKAEQRVNEALEQADHFSSRLDIIEDAMDDIKDRHDYTVDEIFNKDFLSKHTDYDDCEEFFENSGLEPFQVVEYQKYPEIVNKVAATMTDFDTFDEFFKEAVLDFNLKNYGINEVPTFLRDGIDINMNNQKYNG